MHLIIQIFKIVMVNLQEQGRMDPSYNFGSHPEFGFDVKADDVCMHQEGIKRFITHILGLCTESDAGSQVV